jgi:hypothetical protein
MGDEEKLEFEYEQVLIHWRSLADIRFKLLAIVPALAGAAVAIATNNRPPGIEVALGIVGLFATLGILFYDQRNTQLYNDAMARAKFLEELLGFVSHRNKQKPGGLFLSRPERKLKFLGFILMWHDRGLSIVYSAALSSWIFLTVHGVLTSNLAVCLPSMLLKHPLIISLVAATVLGIVIYIDLISKDVDVDRAYRESNQESRPTSGPPSL